MLHFHDPQQRQLDRLKAIFGGVFFLPQTCRWWACTRPASSLVWVPSPDSQFNRVMVQGHSRKRNSWERRWASEVLSPVSAAPHAPLSYGTYPSRGRTCRCEVGFHISHSWRLQGIICHNCFSVADKHKSLWLEWSWNSEPLSDFSSE